MSTEQEAQIQRLAKQLAEDDLRELATVFAAARSAAPQLLWNPMPGQLPAPQMAPLLATWEARGGRRHSARVDADAIRDLGPIHDWLAHVTLGDAGELTFASIGRAVVDVAGTDATGRTITALLADANQADLIFYAAAYGACRSRQQPFLTFNEAHRLNARALSRFVVPFWNERGAVSDFLVVISAVGRPDETTPG